VKYTTLKRADLDVSVIALGCWQFAGGEMWGEQDDKDSIATVHAALDAGITLFDTAEGYGAGKSEEVLGRALEDRRDRAIIATKASGPTFVPDEMVAACEKSLKRLRTDYIDIYQLHWPREGQVEAEEIFTGVERLLSSGKIRHFGVCNFGMGDLENLLSAGSIVSNQVSYSLLWRGIEVELVPTCKAEGIGILTYSSLVHGLLSGRYTDLSAFPDSRARTLHFSSERPGIRHGQPGQEDLTSCALARIGALCSEAGVSMVEAAYGWIAAQPGVTSVLAGARTPSQATENAAIADLGLPPDFLEGLSEATAELKDAFGAHLDMWQMPGRIH